MGATTPGPGKVLHVIDSLAPGGAERSLTELIPQLVGAGIRVDVVVLHDRGGLTDEVRKAGASVFALEGGGRTAWVGQMAKLLRSRRPDLVHTTLFDADLIGRIAARWCGIPVVSSLVSTPYGPEHLGERGLRRSRVRAAQLADIATSRVVRRFRAVSSAVRDSSIERLRLPPALVDVIPEGRDAARLGEPSAGRRAATRARLGVSREPLVLAVARQDPPKGLDVLIRSAPAIREGFSGVQILFAGQEGRSSGELRALVTCLGLSDCVRFLGHRDDVADLLCAADVFVLPSRREGIPGAVQEAMAMGTPIVATDLGGVREAVGDPPLATLFPPDDARSLAAAVLNVLAEPGGARVQSSLARGRFLAEFEIASISQKILAFYCAGLTGAE